MPKRKPRTSAQVAASRRAAVARRFKQHSGRGFRQERYFGRYKSGGVPRSLRGRKPTQTQLAVSRHYGEYVQTRPVSPRRNLGSNLHGTKRLGPDTIFMVSIEGLTMVAFKTSKDKQVKRKYKLLLKALARWYNKVADYVKIELIGDPRTFGGGKGLFPRGGTGYMRLLTRGVIESQISQNRTSPFQMDISVPVEYARYLNETSKLQLAHSKKKDWRVVDYNSGKPKYGKVSLNDPNAVKGFYEKTIDKARHYAGMEFVRAMRRFGLTHNLYLSNTIKVNGLPLRIDRQAFIYSPLEFEGSVPYLGTT